MDDPARRYDQRSKQHEPDHSYPNLVEVRLVWCIDGHERMRAVEIDADRFFGTGGHGAPIEGAALLNHIENLRRQGPPPVEQKGKKNGVQKFRR